MANILVVDDNLGEYKDSIAFALREHAVFFAYSGEDAIRQLEARTDMDCVLLDIKMPAQFARHDEREGIEVLKQLRRNWPAVPVIMFSVLSEIDLVVEAIQEGAFHYLLKPPDREKLRGEVLRATEHKRLSAQVVHLTESHDALVNVYAAGAKPDAQFHGMVGESPRMRQTFGWLERAAAFDTMNVLILGETGTGKELAARAIHACSPRAEGPFVVVNCAAIPDTMLESQLFGHIKGAFTGAEVDRVGDMQAADGGTLFLDEIGDMPLALQSKLLRVTEYKEFNPIGGSSKQVDVRIIAATNKDLSDCVQAGTFRQDLYYRIAGIPIALPPLRERMDDIALLAEVFLHAFCQRNPEKMRPLMMTPDALAALKAHPWPGNVRELRHTIERMAVFASGELITRDMVAQQLADGGAAAETARPETSNEGNETDKEFSVSDDPPRTDTACMAHEVSGIGGKLGIPNVQNEEESADQCDGNCDLPAIGDFNAYKKEHGETRLRHILEQALRQCGSYRAAMTVLDISDDQYDAFRKACERLGLRIRQLKS